MPLEAQNTPPFEYSSISKVFAHTVHTPSRRGAQVLAGF